MIASVVSPSSTFNERCIEQTLLEDGVRGAYQVVREIGRGGMGVVFLARDIQLHRLVAIKVLRHEMCGVEEQRERFRREARHTARLNTAGIVAVHNFGELGDLVYIVMEYVRGKALGAELWGTDAPRPVAPAVVRSILASLARSLDHAHANGIVHRDLKPENVLLEHDTGRPMLTDFGVALSRSLDPEPSEVARAFGTPHFMSPEQAAGEQDLDGRSDIYALGVLGYLMLTGVLPFDGSDYATVVARQVAELPMPIRERVPAVPKQLAQAVERCLEKDPQDRWRRASDLSAALESLTNPNDLRFRVAWLGRVAMFLAVAVGLSGK